MPVGNHRSRVLVGVQGHVDQSQQLTGRLNYNEIPFIMLLGRRYDLHSRVRRYNPDEHIRSHDKYRPCVHRGLDVLLHHLKADEFLLHCDFIIRCHLKRENPQTVRASRQDFRRALRENLPLLLEI